MQFNSCMVAESLLLEHSKDLASEIAAGCICSWFQKQLCSCLVPETAQPPSSSCRLLSDPRGVRIIRDQALSRFCSYLGFIVLGGNWA